MDAETREQRIKRLERLWTETTGRSLKDFDAAIMKRFETTSGRDCLSFEYMEIIEKGLKENVI